MKYEDYKLLPGLTQSTLGDWHMSESPEHFVLRQSDKIDKAMFVQGRLFETFIEDRISSSFITADKFHVIDAPGEMPEEIFRAIENGDDLKTLYVYNKDGARNKQKERFHAWLDVMIDVPENLTPVAHGIYAETGQAVENFFKMEVFGLLVADILRNCEFQKCIQWEKDGIQKKALVDAMLETDTRILVFDFKLMATLRNARDFLRDKYWVQDQHYCEGLEITTGKPVESMRFLIGTKEPPYVACPMYIDDNSRIYARQKYDALIESYTAWEASGRPLTGALPETPVRVFIR
jgi:hypothetical protein